MCSCVYHVIKIAFELVFCKISKFFKIQNSKFFSGSINRNRLSTNWKCLVFKPKLYAWFDQCSIPLDLSKFISNFKGFWQASFCPISQFLFNSSWSLLEHNFFFFFVFFRVKALRFSSTSLVRVFYPFFFIKLQHNMHESFKFLKNF